MPKSFEVINSFEGGINTNSDARDIGSSEYVLLRQVNVKKAGVLQTLGTTQNHASNEPTSSSSTYTQGQGLFLFFTEYNIATNATPDGNGRRVFAMQDDSNGKAIGFAQIQYDNSTADAKINYVLPWSSNGKPDFFFINNALRIYDRGHLNKDAQWFSYIKRNIFPSLTDTENVLSINGWCMLDQEIYSPMNQDKNGNHVSAQQSSTINTDENTVNAKIDEYTNFTLNSAYPNSIPVGIYYTVDSGGGSGTGIDDTIVGWESGKTYNLFVSYIYDERQESLPTYIGSKVLEASGTTFTPTFYAIFPELWTAEGPGSATLMESSMNLNSTTATSYTNCILNGTSDATGLTVGEYFKVDNEIFRVEGVSGTTLTVKRGQLGTTAATHDGSSSAKSLYRLQWNPRITAARLYVTEDALPKDYKYVGEWTCLSAGASSNNVAIKTGGINSDEYPESTTYFTNTLIDLGEYDKTNHKFGITNSIFTHYKVATRFNNDVYIGNLKVTDEGGNTVQHRDRLIRSSMGLSGSCPDVYPNSNTIEANMEDGEQIVELAQVNSSLCVFKESLMFVLDASSLEAGESVMDTFWGLGVLNSGSVVSSGYGVFWATRLGVFLFDGSLQTISKRLNVVGESGYYGTSSSTSHPYVYGTPNFSEFIQKGGDTPVVGFSDKAKQLYIVCSNQSKNQQINGQAGTHYDGDTWIYDFDSGSWVFAQGIFDDTNKSNFLTDYEENFVFMSDGNLKYWDDNATAQAGFAIVTKDFTFGTTTLKKKIYKIMITAKNTSAGPNSSIKYAINNNDAWTDLSSASASKLSATSDSGESYDIITITPANPITCNSIRFYISNSNSSKVTINDMAIEYTTIHKRAD
jgi:hypothetical protein